MRWIDENAHVIILAVGFSILLGGIAIAVVMDIRSERRGEKDGKQ